MEKVKLEGDPLVTKWEAFRFLFKYHLYLLCKKKTNSFIGITIDKDKDEL